MHQSTTKYHFTGELKTDFGNLVFKLHHSFSLVFENSANKYTLMPHIISPFHDRTFKPAKNNEKFNIHRYTRQELSKIYKSQKDATDEYIKFIHRNEI